MWPDSWEEDSFLELDMLLGCVDYQQPLGNLSQPSISLTTSLKEDLKIIDRFKAFSETIQKVGTSDFQQQAINRYLESEESPLEPAVDWIEELDGFIEEYIEDYI